jgi:hypothetical protein
MRFPWLPCLLLASCVPSTLAAPAPSAVRWIPVEGVTHYGAGDGAV